MLFQVRDPGAEQGPHIPGSQVVGMIQRWIFIDPVARTHGIFCSAVAEDHLFLQHAVGQGQLEPGFRFQKNGGDNR